jgi:hypothetical protein
MLPEPAVALLNRTSRAEQVPVAMKQTDCRQWHSKRAILREGRKSRRVHLDVRCVADDTPRG